MGRLWDLIDEHREASPYPPSYRQIALSAGINPSTFMKWQTIKSLPDREHLQAVARTIGVSYTKVLIAALKDVAYISSSLEAVLEDAIQDAGLPDFEGPDFEGPDFVLEVKNRGNQPGNAVRVFLSYRVADDARVMEVVEKIQEQLDPIKELERLEAENDQRHGGRPIPDEVSSTPATVTDIKAPRGQEDVAPGEALVRDIAQGIKDERRKQEMDAEHRAQPVPTPGDAKPGAGERARLKQKTDAEQGEV